MNDPQDNQRTSGLASGFINVSASLSKPSLDFFTELFGLDESHQSDMKPEVLARLNRNDIMHLNLTEDQLEELKKNVDLRKQFLECLDIASSMVGWFGIMLSVGSAIAVGYHTQDERWPLNIVYPALTFVGGLGPTFLSCNVACELGRRFDNMVEARRNLENVVPAVELIPVANVALPPGGNQVDGNQENVNEEDVNEEVQLLQVVVDQIQEPPLNQQGQPQAEPIAESSHTDLQTPEIFIADGEDVTGQNELTVQTVTCDFSQLASSNIMRFTVGSNPITIELDSKQTVEFSHMNPNLDNRLKTTPKINKVGPKSSGGHKPKR